MLTAAAPIHASYENKTQPLCSPPTPRGVSLPRTTPRKGRVRLITVNLEKSMVGCYPLVLYPVREAEQRVPSLPFYDSFEPYREARDDDGVLRREKRDIRLISYER